MLAEEVYNRYVYTLHTTGNPYWLLEETQKLSKEEKLKPKNIEKIIFNPPATIVIFADGTKSVVKCGAEDAYCPEVGLAQALMNIMFDSRSGFKNFIKEKGVFPQNHKKE